MPPAFENSFFYATQASGLRKMGTANPNPASFSLYPTYNKQKIKIMTINALYFSPNENFCTIPNCFGIQFTNAIPSWTLYAINWRCTIHLAIEDDKSYTFAVGDNIYANDIGGTGTTAMRWSLPNTIPTLEGKKIKISITQSE